MKYVVKPTAQFKKDLKRAKKLGCDMLLIEEIIVKLSNGEKLDGKHKDHSLTGNYTGRRECHITPAWLLIYQIIETNLILVLTRTGSHSDMF